MRRSARIADVVRKTFSWSAVRAIRTLAIAGRLRRSRNVPTIMGMRPRMARRAYTFDTYRVMATAAGLWRVSWRQFGFELTHIRLVGRHTSPKLMAAVFGGDTPMKLPLYIPFADKAMAT